MKCPSCGFDNPPGFAFCGQCGNRLAAAEDQLTSVEFDHLRLYLPSSLIDDWQFDLAAPPPNLLKQTTDHLYRLIDTTTTYLPAHIVDRILRDPVPGQISGQFVDGSLMFADISGFTPMSERLSRIGREGAEEITGIVNRYFGTMMAILREYDGYLVKFGGDALLSLFLEPNSAKRAVQSAVRMQAAMHEFAELHTSQGVFPLLMKIGLRKGRFFSAQLGNAENMEYMLFGSDVNATALAEGAALAGEVLLDRETYSSLDVPCRVRPAQNDDRFLHIEHIETRRDFQRAPTIMTLLPAPTLKGLRRALKVLSALTPYLPAGLLARLASSPQGMTQEGEHRLVATAFANVHGLGELVDRLGPGREAEIVNALNQYFLGMDQAVHGLGGVISKLDLAEHGDKLLAFFGAPVAHEDDAERAVRAALKMQAALREMSSTLPQQVGLPDLKLAQQVGVTFGQVFAGYMGTAWRREYTVMGDEVNLAARLMAVAERGQILVSGSAQRKVQALFSLTARGEVRVKGKSDPVSTFQVTGLRAMTGPLRGLEGLHSSLVGRATEWEQLATALQRLRSGRGQVVSIVGEAGLGKSRLAAELRAELPTADSAPSHLGVRWFETRCVSFYESASYRSMQELIGQLIDLHSDDGGTAAWRKLRAAVEPWPSADNAAASLPYLAHFLGLPLSAVMQEKVRYLNAEALQRRTFIALRTLIEMQAQTAPVIFMLDDIHWMDQASLDLLEYLLPLTDVAPIMWLLLYRAERSKGCWKIRERAVRDFPHAATEITLERLSPAETQQLLSNLIRLLQWPLSVQDLILRRVEGNPLYLEEVLRTFIENGALARDGRGVWHMRDDVTEIRVPDTLQGVMMARLDQLEEPPRQTAQVAAVVGRSFPFKVLSHVIDTAHIELNPCLVRLQQNEIVREDQRVPDLIYAFQHTLMQEVCYESLLARTRREYHRKIAQFLETNRSDPRGPAGDVALLAHHAYAGQDWPRALTYQIEAGQQAQRLFANHEAIDHFNKALRCAEQLPPEETAPQRLSIHSALGELLTTTGQYDQALEQLTTGRAIALERDDAHAYAHLCRWLARLYELRGEYPSALEWVRQGLETSEGRETADAAEMLITAGLIYSRQGEYETALEQCQRGLSIAEHLAELTVLARAYNLLGHLTRLLGHSALAIEDFQAAQAFYERAGDIQGQAIAQNQLANAYFDTGHWRLADENYQHAREAFNLLGDVYNRSFAENNLGGIALNQGRLDEALSYYHSALEALARIGGSEYVLGALHNNLGATYIRRGELEAGRDHLYTSRHYFERTQSRDFLPELHRHLAEAALASDQQVEAETQGQQALALARELTMRSEEGHALRVLGQVRAAQQLWSEAERYLNDSLSALEEAHDTYSAARTRLALAQARCAQGHGVAALDLIDRCLEVFSHLNAQLDVTAAQTLREQVSARLKRE
ncbi:adenylate cyclase 10 [Thermoflexales bacterium]|nr:adenylate cyclase 10 [Thermoflexales bacterium]